MPRIFDNITEKLQDALIQTLPSADSADFCVGYFNLRGWRLLASSVDHMTGGDGACVRLLIGMTTTPQDEVRRLFSLLGSESQIDLSAAVRLKNKIVDDFRQQLTVGVPSDADEAGLRQLAGQLRDKKLAVKLYLRGPLHAKLYLTHRHDYNNPRTAFLGSSNLTLSGLAYNGELNTDVTDYSATEKLAAWFDERWADRFSLDITDALADVIDQSWAGEQGLTPYEVYLKIAYHMAQEAIAGLSGEFKLPKIFADKLYDYQAAAVQIAAHHVNKRDGVLLGDVVGLGKTLMAAAVAKIFQEDHGMNTLILCPPNLAGMWRGVIQDYGLIGDVLPTSRAMQDLPGLRRYRLVIIDESHNLRNAEGRRYAAIRDYIAENDSKVMLLSATPYNKTYLDLAAQLGLFIPDTRDLGVRPEAYLRDLGGEATFMSKHQTTVRTLAAFAHSPYPDDWHDLMRLYMVRRTRSFITAHYAKTDPDTGRKYIQNRDGNRSYFPTRIPKTVAFEANPQYRRLYSDLVVDAINGLNLPRHGLSLYVSTAAEKTATPEEKKLLDNLGRAGKRLIGFTRTGLFKRLESSGDSFLQSIDRHILRNCLFLHALKNGLNLPIGTLDIRESDSEDDDIDPLLTVDESDSQESASVGGYEARAMAAYAQLSGRGKSRYKWLRPTLFTPKLMTALEADNATLIEVLRVCGPWEPDDDSKLAALFDLITQTHPDDKVLVFSQFADTVTYLERELRQRGVTEMAAATGHSHDVTALARRFSPFSNRPLGSDDRFVRPADALRVLISTDVLSEGQNLQDAAIVVNFDLPWAIIRLSQRAGRVDRIGQQAERILCYSFLPQDGVEQIIRLRARVSQRLNENGEVIGSDEQFFEDDAHNRQLKDLYTEKSYIPDDETDNDVDLASEAYQIWDSATRENDFLRRKIESLPDVVYATREYVPTLTRPAGVITYLKTGMGADALAWMGADGQPITQSQVVILRAAACSPDTPAIERRADHHDLVRTAMELIYAESQGTGGVGSLGSKTGPRARAYERMKAHYEDFQRTAPLFIPPALTHVVDDLYHYPLTASARDTIVRQMRTNIGDEDLAKLLIYLRDEGRLSQILSDVDDLREPHIVCSLGLMD